ncbi:hypothetical protein GUJ93_ZPchr0004g39057 [Zizania palustris]|uniref:Uncharacterized protein n=1 Tax=Zizania palustris TaxID=103762 RepID=A0A8J5SYU5_ZIZPA|nr:hypothetical protein GUJ93_ZPchr0004g39057 [Zizania palustris]
MEERVLEAVTALAAKVEGIDQIQEKLMQIDFKLELQRERMDQMQSVVNQVQLEQVTMARTTRTTTGAAQETEISSTQSPVVPPATILGMMDGLERDRGQIDSYPKRWVPRKWI